MEDLQFAPLLGQVSLRPRFKRRPLRIYLDRSQAMLCRRRPATLLNANLDIECKSRQRILRQSRPNHNRHSLDDPAALSSVATLIA